MAQPGTSSYGTVAVVPHPERRSAYDLSLQIIEKLEVLGATVRVPSGEASALGRPDLACDAVSISEGLDLAVSIGGDGTMLRAVGLARGAAVLGINLGALGFLAEVEPDEALAALDRLVTEEYLVDERTTLDAIWVGCEKNAPQDGGLNALNEISVEKAHPQRLVEIGVSIDGEPFTTFRADGVLVATSTGSTAYAMSVRGPIVSPRLSCLVVVPVAPHGLFDRPLVLSEDEDVVLTVVGDRQAVLTVDGQRKATMDEGDGVRIVKGANPARLVRLHPRVFHRIIKKKFGLAGAS